MLILPSHADRRLFQPGAVSHNHGLHDPDGELDAANAAMCKLIGEKLAKHYPGHPWAVASEIEHGIVKIALQGFMQWSYIVHVKTLKGDPSLRAIVRAGGEILERLRMPRTGFDLGDYVKATTAMPHHFFRNKKAPV
jgi:hypothetical protein